MSEIINDQRAPQPQPEPKRSPLVPVLIVAVVALLGAVAYLWNAKSTVESEKVTVENKLDETEQLKLQLNSQYYESLNELESMRGTNAELNELIDSQKADLEQQRNRITRLMADKRNLGAARNEIAKLKAQTEQYVVEINQLREENGLLTQQNATLSTENQGLQQTVAETNMANQELTNARAELISEKEVLLTDKANLTEKVTMASSVKVANIETTGLRLKDNGKTVRKKYAKNVDLLNVCFETTENNIVQPGDEVFHVRIINPLGETLAVEEMGSGVLVNALTKEQVRFTKTVDHTYANGVGEVCMTWDAPAALAKGEYGVQVYNKNYLAGEGSFRLK